MSSCGAILLSACALAAPTAAAQHDVGWDLRDPLNLVEMRDWFCRLWDADVSGDLPTCMAGFRWTHEAPHEKFTLLLNGVRLFKQLHASILDQSLISDEPFGLFDLLSADRAVEERFRLYLSHGMLETPLDGDPNALYQHLLLVSTPGMSSWDPTLSEEVWVEDGVLRSRGLLPAD